MITSAIAPFTDPSDGSAGETVHGESTGVPMLDARLGSLVPGRHYLFTGSPGAGKTTFALHFIVEGLRVGQRCGILTQDAPEDLLAHGDYLGHDLRPAVADGRLVVLQFRMDFLRRYSRLMSPELVYEELAEMLSEGGERPGRLVIDSAAPFLEGGSVANDLIDGLGSFLEGWEGVTYVTIPGDIHERSQRRLYDRVVSSAAGVFQIDRIRGTRRELSVQKLRQGSARTDPFTFEIRSGGGIEPGVDRDAPEALPPEVRRRVLVLDQHGAVPAGFRRAVSQSFTVEAFQTLERGFGEIAAGRYGALLIGLDPYRPNPAIDLARSLRRSGNGAPILFVCPREGLRSSTRARALRAGGDDFLTTDTSAVELLERIGAASGRGHRAAGSHRVSDVPVQPTSEDGSLRPMADVEFREAIACIIEQPTPPLFAVILLKPTSTFSRAWDVLRGQVRLADGDLVAVVEDEYLGVYLSHVDRGTAEELAERLADAHQARVELLHFPEDRDAIVERLGTPSSDAHLQLTR